MTLMRFTADDAFEASENGEPILVGLEWIKTQLANHGIPYTDLKECADQADPIDTAHGCRYDAAKVLAWLGY